MGRGGEAPLRLGWLVPGGRDAAEQGGNAFQCSTLAWQEVPLGEASAAASWVGREGLRGAGVGVIEVGGGDKTRLEWVE